MKIVSEVNGILEKNKKRAKKGGKNGLPDEAIEQTSLIV